MTRLFGTNGIRGVVNKDITSEFALDIGKAWGTFLKRTKKRPNIVIGTDARISNTMLKHSVSAGLLATGCDVTDIGLVPTPALQYMVKIKQFDSGVMITASHNPAEFNGIKGIDSDGTEFSKQTEECIEEIYYSNVFELVTWDEIGCFNTVEYANESYIKGIISKVDYVSIKKKGFHVVLDCGSGSGSVVTPLLLEKLGCKVTRLYCEPDGRFPGHPSEPTPENVAELVAKMKETHADVGVAQDGDADRAIFVDEQGTYIWGDQTLSLFAKYMTLHKPKSIVVTPVTSSTSVDDVVRKNKGTVIRTQVGSPIVARVMREKDAIFGGEENGGLIFPEFQFCRDSAMTIAKVLELLVNTRSSLSDLLLEIPRYEMVKKKLRCPDSIKQDLLKMIQDQIQDDSSITRIDMTDGLKVYYPKGWVLMRPSGTEPLFRIYTESKKKDDAKQLSSLFLSIVESLITKMKTT
ncbi:MAG: phosphoglucosamine mutase [Candidatus Thermoplasmatota archaeon]|nr:phosphoglucosamine mutase [Candidatus Thermoplasmatota archaeon]